MGQTAFTVKIILK